MQIVASRLPADALLHYGGLYYPHGGVFDWRINRDVTARADAINKHLSGKYSDVSSGLRPELIQYNPPKLHQIKMRKGRLSMTYVEWGKPRASRSGYDTVTTQPPIELRVALRDDPFTIEMRHVPYRKQPVLAVIIGNDIGHQFLHASLDSTTLCRLTTAATQNTLGEKLGAIETDVYWVGNGVDNLNHCSVGSDETISVRLLPDFLAQVERFPFREEAKRTWVFYTHHAYDSHYEKAYYSIKLLRGTFVGEMTVSDAISDTAIDNLRNNVAALF